MTNNDILKRLRYALSISDKLAVKIFRLGKTQMTEEEFCSLLLRPDEDDFQKCNNSLLFSFLDGLIVLKRGNLEKPAEEIKITKNNLNNLILRKLKIALNLKSEDMLSLFKLGGAELSNSELSALFRKEGHKNYRECGDKYIRVFLKGLTEYYRK